MNKIRAVENFLFFMTIIVMTYSINVLGAEQLKQPVKEVSVLEKHEAIFETIKVEQPEINLHPNPTETPEVKKSESNIEKEEVELRYDFTEDDIYIMAQLLCGSGEVDGDGEYDIDFQDPINYGEVKKVLTIVMNRVESDQFPDTPVEVILQPNQFSPMPENSNKTPSDKAVEIVVDWCYRWSLNNSEVVAASSEYLYFTGDGATNKISTHW